MVPAVHVVGTAVLGRWYWPGCLFDQAVAYRALPRLIREAAVLANYRKILELVLAGRSYGEIVEVVGCSRREVSRVR